MSIEIQRLWGQFFSKTRTINNEPLNKVSLIVIILVDIFILINVFTGLNDISQWHLSPSQVYPCYGDWQNYRISTAQDRDYRTVRDTLDRIDRRFNSNQNYRQVELGHLGKVSPVCLQFGEERDRLNQPSIQSAIKTIDRQQTQIANLQQTNQKIRAQYDSTLLEKIAKQARSKSINSVDADRAKQELDRNTSQITTLDRELATLKTNLLDRVESQNFLSFLKEDAKFKELENQHQQAAFWYPTIQLACQTLFLLPLIAIALVVHNFAGRKNYGLVALISWHLLAIFSIPLVIKVFEFLQIGIIFNWLFKIISTIFGGLLFILSFLYILIIPFVGFGIIKFAQKFVFNPQVQAATRVQTSRCMNCAKKIRSQDAHCPHCGYYQYLECSSCHSLTYKNLPYCKECGHPQPQNRDS